MKEALSKEELEDELCKYCTLTDYGLKEVNTHPLNLCLFGWCNDAYEEYLEQFKYEEEK